MRHPDVDRLEWMNRVRSDLAEATSLSAPDASWSIIESRLDRGDAVVLPADATPRGRSRTAAVAGSLLLCATVVAALVPQTGVRAWIERQLARESVVPPATTTNTNVAAMAVSPANGVVRVVLTSVAPLRLHVRLGDGADLDVIATQGAAGARFTAGVGRIEIDDAAGGAIELVLPRRARLITVDIDGVRAVEARGTELTVLAARADTAGIEIIVPVRGGH